MIKGCFIAPCIGLGGADAYMLGLMRHCTNIDWVSLGLGEVITQRQWDWFKAMYPKPIKVNQTVHPGKPQIVGPDYFDGNDHNFFNAQLDADIIISWCMPKLQQALGHVDKPLIEIVQNGDKYAWEVAQTNLDRTDYRVACSNFASRAFGEKKTDAVIYNAIEPSRVTPKYGREWVRQVWGLNEKKILLFMGRLVDEKVPQCLIQALLELPEEWVGVCVGDYGYRRDDLIIEAKRYLPPDKIFTMESIYYVGDILAAADCFILTSDFEGHPLAVLEAWLAGTPTVLSENAAILEMKNIFGDTAIYVPVRPTNKQIAEAVLKSQEDESLPLFNKARSVVWNNFTITTAATQWEEFIYKCYEDWQKRRRRPFLIPVGENQPKNSTKTWVRKVQEV